MAVGRTRAIALQGLDGSVVEIEADISNTLPGIAIIGLPDASLGEARERVRAAASNSGCPLTDRKLTVNLSPASLPKHGSAFDLGIAVAALAANGGLGADSVAEAAHIGELGLDGRLRPLAGVLPATAAAARAGISTILVPLANRAEAELVPGIRVVGVASLRDAAIHHGADLEPWPVDAVEMAAASAENEPALELADVAGNPDAVEAMVAAAAGGHHMFLLGPPGAGKTMLASRLTGIIPDLDADAALQVTSIRSLAGEPPAGRLASRPPFEAPHHTATAASLVGGGSRVIRPGSAVRASHGVLFLDEAPEFSASVLDALRQPLESGEIAIHRAVGVARYPARFQLVLAANPCGCGQFGAADIECSCTPHSRRRYLGKLSGPLLDRLDIQLRVSRVTAAQLRYAREHPGVDTATARSRVEAARAVAAERLAGTPWRLNRDVPGSWLRSPAGAALRGATAELDRALELGALTMRGYDRVLRLAWTIGDLEGVSRPGADHVGRALLMRKAI